MTKGRVSVIIPARQEQFLAPTIVDILKQATGDIEVVACLDGWWPDPPLPSDPRVKILHWGAPKGLRPSINAGVQISTGEFLLKFDAHCSVMPGFDEALKPHCGDNEIIIPAKYSLEASTWTPKPKPPWHYFYLTWPWDPELPCIGLQDRNYGPSYNKPREHMRVDDILSFQGSAWMLRRPHWDRLGPMDPMYYYAQEPQELGLRTWLGGGRVKIIKDVWYAHLWKGKVFPRTFTRVKDQWAAAMEWSAWYWMTNQWTGRLHDFSWLVQKFGPLPGWPQDWEAQAAERWKVR